MPNIPILDADMGKAWLHLKADPKRAEIVPGRCQDDPSNAEVYVGLDEAMSLTGISAAGSGGGAWALSFCSDKSSLSPMPSNLVYQLALTRAEAGQSDEALDLFKDRFFPERRGRSQCDSGSLRDQTDASRIRRDYGRVSKAEEFLAAGHAGLEVNGAISQPYMRMAAIARLAGTTNKRGNSCKGGCERKWRGRWLVTQSCNDGCFQ